MPEAGIGGEAACACRSGTAASAGSERMNCRGRRSPTPPVRPTPSWPGWPSAGLAGSARQDLGDDHAHPAALPADPALALIAVFAYGVHHAAGSGSWISIRSILVLAALVGLASGGQTLLILMGGFDLSGLRVHRRGRARRSPRSAASTTSPSRRRSLIALVAARRPRRLRGLHLPPLPDQSTGRDARDGDDCARPRRGAERRERHTPTRPQWLRSTSPMPVTKTFGIGLPPSVAIWIVVVILFAVFLHRTRSGRQPVRDRRQPARRRLRADQHPPRLDRRVRFQRGRPRRSSAS